MSTYLLIGNMYMVLLVFGNGQPKLWMGPVLIFLWSFWFKCIIDWKKVMSCFTSKSFQWSWKHKGYDETDLSCNKLDIIRVKGNAIMRTIMSFIWYLLLEVNYREKRNHVGMFIRVGGGAGGMVRVVNYMFLSVQIVWPKDEEYWGAFIIWCMFLSFVL